MELAFGWHLEKVLDCCAAGCGRLSQDLVMASTFKELLSCCAWTSCSSCSTAALHNMAESCKRQFCVGWPNDAYSGMRRAITFVADEGAKPSPSPTCRAAQAGLGTRHLHRPSPAEQAVASASQHGHCKLSTRAGTLAAIDPGNTLLERTQAGSSVATQALNLDGNSCHTWCEQGRRSSGRRNLYLDGADIVHQLRC